MEITMQFTGGSSAMSISRRSVTFPPSADRMTDRMNASGAPYLQHFLLLQYFCKLAALVITLLHTTPRGYRGGKLGDNCILT